MVSTLMSASFAAANFTTPIEMGNRSQTTITKDESVMLRTAKPFKEVRVVDAEIADVLVLTNQSFQLMGRKRGKTNVMLYDEQSRLIDVVDVMVDYDFASLRQVLGETFPNERIEVKSLADGLYLSGTVNESSIATRALNIAQAYAPQKVTNGLKVRDSHQVLLEVRFVEATRDAVKSLGIGLLTERAGDFAFQSGAALSQPALQGLIENTIGRTRIDTSIEALEEKGIVRTLAKPNLVSMSGETASFLAGGEFPIPVRAEDGEITVEFRQFGVSLAFTPTVLDDAVINLKVVPEVSQLDPTNTVRIGGVEVPGLRVRRVNTTIELRNSQSFAIAGLLQNDSSDRKVQTPWLGDIPVIGSLFRSTRYQNSETELVIIVTPRLVQPVPDIQQLATPLDGTSEPNAYERFLTGKLEGPSGEPQALSEVYGYATQ
jgi:pilus assembly protein CpaC